MQNYYAQIDYDQPLGINGSNPISDNGSLLVSMCNLLQVFDLGYSIDPASLNDYFASNELFTEIGDKIYDKLNWDTLIRFDSSLNVVKIDTGWPQKKYAIVKFRCRSHQQPTKILDGKEADNIINHFCVMLDPDKKLIIDSFDGEVKPAEPYGVPIAYALYASNGAYVDTKYEETYSITYQKFQKPVRMYVAKQHAQKIIFGQINHLKDIEKTTVGDKRKYGEEVIIYGKALHPVLPTGATFYMDGAAIGSYSGIGKPAEAVGYYDKDLSTTPPPPLEKKPKSKQIEAQQDWQQVIEQEATKKPDLYPNFYKTTYRLFEKPKRVLFKDTMSVHEMDGRRNSKLVYKNWGTVIVGTFEKDGNLYGRPKDAAEAGLWFGIPMEMLDDYEEVYNTELELPEKIVLHQQGKHGMSLQERGFATFSRVVAKGVKVQSYVKALTKQKTKE